MKGPEPLLKHYRVRPTGESMDADKDESSSKGRDMDPAVVSTQSAWREADLRLTRSTARRSPQRPFAHAETSLVGHGSPARRTPRLFWSGILAGSAPCRAGRDSLPRQISADGQAIAAGMKFGIEDQVNRLDLTGSELALETDSQSTSRAVWS